MNLKEYCDCGKLATWVYMTGYSNGDSPYHCDDCVPRGCDCNHRYCDVASYHPPLRKPDLPEGVEGVDWKWITKDVIWTKLDEKGREYPCAEFDWDPDGYEREINPHKI
jgi:hypothetical protein